MITFWIICALMVLLTLWFVLPALLKRDPEAKPDEARAANLLVYQDQHRELEADLKNGLLTEEQYQKDKEELERRLLDDVPAGEASSTPSRPLGTRKLAYALAVAIPVAAVLFYLFIGNPKAAETVSPSPPSTMSR